MAFIFTPPFNEGDKQTNPDTGVEYIYSGGAWRALGAKIEDEFDTLDDRYVKLTGTSRTTGTWRIKGDNVAGDGEQTFQSIGGGYQKLYHIQTPEDSNTGWVANVEYVQSHIDEKIAAIPDVDLNGYATEDYVDNAITDANLDQYLKKSGGTITGTLTFQRGEEKDEKQFKISPNAGTDYATSIYSLNNGQMRFRSSHTESEGGHIGSHIILDPNGGAPETKIYHVVTPTREDHAVNKQYVDDKVASSGGGVPVGSIMIWMNSTPPDGWFKLQGSTFDVSKYPLLHAYLQGTSGYSSGRLPNWGGYYPGEYGDHLTHSLGSKQGYKTGMPSGGAPYHPNSIPNGNTRTFNATGGTNAYSDGKARPAITEGWDSTTRPKTVVVHYIIKHD